MQKKMEIEFSQISDSTEYNESDNESENEFKEADDLIEALDVAAIREKEIYEWIVNNTELEDDEESINAFAQVIFSQIWAED